MRRTILALAAGAMLACVCSQRDARAAQVSADINLHIGSRPAPEVVFEREPPVVLIPTSRVYCVDHLDYDLFRFEGFWYMNDSGYWYRADSYRGPFISIDFARVPRSIVVLPSRYHHHPFHPHGGPPGQMKKAYRDGSRHQDRDRDVIVKDGRKGGRGARGGRGGRH